MTYDEMYSALNKGIPNYLSIELDINVLLKECVDDHPKFLNELRKIREEYQNKIYNICGRSKAQYYFFETFRTYTSYRNSETSISISPIPFITKLKDIMGVQSDSVDFNDEDLKNKLLERLEILKNIKTEDELKNEFPLIYEDYQLSLRAYQQIFNESNIEKQSILRKHYSIYGLDTRFNVFMSHQVNMYRNFIIRRQFVEGYCNRNYIDLDKFSGLNKDKFEMYMAYLYLERAKNSSDFDEVQECVKYLSNYIREYRVNNNQNIFVNVGDYKVTFRKLILGYSKLFRRFKDLVPLDSDRLQFKGYHYNHVKNHISKYYGNFVNWFLVPNGNIEEYNDEERMEYLKELKRTYNYLSLEERNKVINKIFEVYNNKVKFYEGSNYAFKLIGLDGFNGYIAYVYSNGTVILDKLFRDFTTALPTYNEALYIMDISYFELLSRFDKQELQQRDDVIRKYHSTGWEDRVRSILDDNTSESPKVEQLKLQILKKDK